MTAVSGSDAASVPSEVKPPEGFWQREVSHYPRPLSPASRTTFLPAVNVGVREPFRELGLLVETVEFREIGGWVYQRIVPLGGRDRRAPAWLMPFLIRVVPSLRSRIKRCVAAINDGLPDRRIEQWYDEWKPDLVRELNELRALDLTALSEANLAQHLERTVSLLERGERIHFLLHGALGMILAELAFDCRDRFGWDDRKTFELLNGLSQQSTEPARRLRELALRVQGREALRRTLDEARDGNLDRLAGTDAEFAAAVRAFLQDHGYRALRYELAEPTMLESPAFALGLIQDQVRRSYHPDADTNALEQRRAAVLAEARGVIESMPPGSRETRPQVEKRRAAAMEGFRRLLRRAERAYPVREDNEYYTNTMPLAALRFALLEVGRRLAARGDIDQRDDIFLLEIDDVRAALRQAGDRRPLVQQRKAERERVEARPGPASYGVDPGPPPPLNALPPQARFAMEAFQWYFARIIEPEASNRQQTEGARLQGTPASPGQYTGPARIILGEDDFERIQPGDVLVCPITSPVWSVLFPSVGALVTDTGGILSHPAIIAREYRVPAVVATGNATSLLKDGQTLTVNGTAGTVEVKG